MHDLMTVKPIHQFNPRICEWARHSPTLLRSLLRNSAILPLSYQMKHQQQKWSYLQSNKFPLFRRNNCGSKIIFRGTLPWPLYTLTLETIHNDVLWPIRKKLSEHICLQTELSLKTIHRWLTCTFQRRGVPRRLMVAMMMSIWTILNYSLMTLAKAFCKMRDIQSSASKVLRLFPYSIFLVETHLCVP